MQGVTHIAQSDSECGLRLQSERKWRAWQACPGEHRVAKRLGSFFEDLEQSLYTPGVPNSELAPEVYVMGEHQGRECRHMGRCGRRAVAGDIAIRRLAGDHCHPWGTQVDFRTSA